MANKIVLKKSSVAAKVPLSTDLEVGEIAVNLTDQKLYSKKSDGTVILVGSGVSGGGDVVGPVSSTDNALARFDSTTGKLIQNSTVTLDDNGTLANVNAISLDTTPTTPPTTAGSIYWDNGNGTPSVVLNASTELQLGQENIAKVYNGSGSTIANGSVVAVNGAQGQRPSVTLADADSEPLSAATLGIATESIANGAEGFICTFGLVRGINTSAFTEGLPIYLSQTAGQFTQTRPSAPAHTVALGWVIKANASSGEVFVNINNGWELDELHNVLITSPSSGNTLIYDATANVWKNANLTAGTGISVTNGAGSIIVNNTGVTSVSGTGTVNGLTLTGTVTTSGNLTLGGTLSGIANSALTNSSVTVNGTSIALGASGTITANNPNDLTINNGGAGAASGTTYNGSSAITISYNTVGAPSTTGTNASGTWGISISGNAATATSANNLTSYGVLSNIDTFYNSGEFAWNETTVGRPASYGQGIGIVSTGTAWNGSNNWYTQLAFDTGTSAFFRTRVNAGAWSSWFTFLHSGNYNSYAPTLTGGGASGTWGISITGNAGNTSSISNAVGNSYTWTGTQYFRVSGGDTGNTNGASLQAYGNGASGAYMAFHRPGYYAVNMGLDSDNVMRIGGWSASANRWELDMSGNNWVASSSRAPIFYDSNNTGYYADPNGTSRLATVNADLLRSYGNVYTDGNYGHGLVGLYSPSRFQGVFAMGDAYKLPADGYTTGNLYGIAWSYPNAGGAAANLNTHGALFLENGQFMAAIAGSIRCRDDMRAPIFYDSNDTGWYCNPAGTSRFQSIQFLSNNWSTSTDGYNRLYFEGGASTYIRGVSGSWYCQFGSTSTTTSILEGNGNFYTTGAVTAYWSDKRLKKNIKRINDWREILGKINGYRFEWNNLGLKMMGESAEEEKGVKVGILAQEAKEALPQSAVVQLMQYENKVDGVLIPKKDINYDPENPYLTVQMEKYIPVLIEASKGLMDENEQLKATIQSLMGRVITLENKGI